MISYTLNGIIISNDDDLSCPPLVLPLTATPAEVAAAAAAYMPPAANFNAFGLWLLTDPGVQAAYDQAFAGDKLTAGTLQPAVLAAAGGDASYLRAVLLLLRRQGLLGDDVLQAMAAKATSCHLPAEFIQAIDG
jgi:hypothetical protein